jgi:hypothetical protein
VEIYTDGKKKENNQMLISEKPITSYKKEDKMTMT